MLTDTEANYDKSPSELHMRMVEWFGLPTPTEREHEEVFGWYHVDDDTRYWVFNPEDGFRVINGEHGAKMLSGEWEDGDLDEIARGMDHLSFLPRPPLPADQTSPARGEPFAFEGWLFAWFFFPELRRWELGVIERRWRAEPEGAVNGASNPNPSTASERRHDQLLSLATKTIVAGAQLFDRYRRAMLLLGTWTAPDPRTGFRLIAGAAAAAASQFSEHSDVIRLVSRATGCGESQVQSVVDYLTSLHLLENDWFRGASSDIVFEFGESAYD